jgi:hypothetical protein
MSPAPERPDHVHQQRFDGDDPYLVCDCGARWDAISGSQLYALPRAAQDDILALAPVTDAGLRELADGINAAVTLRLIGGNTDQTYSPNEVAVMVHEVVEQQYAALSRQAEKETA